MAPSYAAAFVGAELRAGYLHVSFPGTSPAVALAGLDEAIARAGWVATGDPGDTARAAGRVQEQFRVHRRWRHGVFPVGLYRVVIGMHPVAVAIAGQRVHTVAVPVLGRYVVRRTLRRLLRHAVGLGAVPLADRGLLEFNGQAQRRWARAVEIAHEMGMLRFRIAHRQCPDCSEWCEPGRRWCWRCEHEFSGEDDHVHDVAAAAARQRLAWLEGQGLDGPAGQAPAPPPFTQFRPRVVR